MTDKVRRAAAAKFASEWKRRGNEKSETQSFWLTLLQRVYDVEEPEKYIAFEMPVEVNNPNFIDGYISETSVLIEQKGWCLWLKAASPSDIKKSSILYKKVKAVQQFRLESKAKTTNGYAKAPHLFAQITQPDNVNYLIIPSVSSEKRRYIPIGFINGDTISSNAVQIVPNATLYHFGILTSTVHMAWMRAVCGRLEMRYRYSKELVYNTFPWPAPTAAQKAAIERTAQAILDARALHPGDSLADLYDETLMPPELRRAHQKNDRAVMSAYGFSVNHMTENMCVAELMRRYQELTKAG